MSVQDTGATDSHRIMQAGSQDLFQVKGPLLAPLQMLLRPRESSTRHKLQTRWLEDKSRGPIVPNRVRSVTRRYTSFENGHGPVLAPGIGRIGGQADPAQRRDSLLTRMCSASDDGLPETKAGDCAGRTPGPATPWPLALRHIPSDDQSSGGQQAAAKDACM